MIDLLILLDNQTFVKIRIFKYAIKSDVIVTSEVEKGLTVTEQYNDIPNYHVDKLIDTVRYKRRDFVVVRKLDGSLIVKKRLSKY